MRQPAVLCFVISHEIATTRRLRSTLAFLSTIRNCSSDNFVTIDSDGRAAALRRCVFPENNSKNGTRVLRIRM